MPVVNSCNYSGIYEAVSTRFSIKQRGQGCKYEHSNRSSSSTPKKTKESISVKAESSPVTEILEEQTVGSNITPETLQNVTSSINHVKASVENKIKENKSNSIVSGSQRIRELQELHRELSKSSYEPSKPIGTDFKPRKPTMEAIKSAIGKAKLKQKDTTSNKSVGTDDERPNIVMADASTSTNQSSIKKKKKKKVKKTTITEEGKKTKKKKTVEVKVKTKIKVNDEEK